MPLLLDSQNGSDVVARLWQHHLQPFGGLLSLQLAISQQIYARDGLLEIGIALGERLDDERSVLRPAQGRYIEIFLCLIKTDISRIKFTVHSFVKALGIDFDICLCNWSLAEFHPRTGSEDTLAVDRHPGFEVVEHLGLLVVVGAIGPQGDAQQQVAILRHDIHELLHHRLGTLVAIFLVYAGLIVPVADAVTGLRSTSHVRALRWSPFRILPNTTLRGF